MKITVVSTRQQILDHSAQYEIAVVLDILRATTTITTAFDNGCQQVIPVAEVAAARNLAQNYSEALLGGERKAIKLPGFDLGNSPLEYTQQAVAGKTVILTTTNGTGAIKLAAQVAPVVLIGCLRNARAVAKKLTRFNHILLACAGTNGRFSLDDTLAAGYIIKELLTLKGENYSGMTLANKRPATDKVYHAETPVGGTDGHTILNDQAVAAYRLALYYENNTLDALYDTLHGQKLFQLGLAVDLKFCAQVNATAVVPYYHNGIVRLF